MSNEMGGLQYSGCEWQGELQLMIDYHNHEWGVPVHDDKKHFEFLILDAFQAGLSWSTIIKKREAFREAFAGFDVQKVACFSEKDVEQLMNNAAIIRNRSKIVSTITNALAFIQIQQEFGSFNNFIWQFTNFKTIHHQYKVNAEIPSQSIESQLMSKALKKRGFNFVGPTICYAYMQAAGMVNDHLVGCPRHRYLQTL